ncbi:MAG: hypothetical protein U0746_20190 [Gemmataceae bacterium]
MTAMAAWTDDDTQKAQAAWAEYQRQHDVSARHGQAVGIDPQTGRVWFGDNLAGVTAAARADGVTTPLLCLRVGYSYYQRS